MNLVLLTGRIGNEPQVKEFENGKSVAFSLATNENYKNAQGETVEKTEWHNIVGSGKIAELVEKYLAKGSLVSVQGKLRTRNYEDKDGHKKYITEIRISRIEFLDSKKQNQTSSAQSVAQVEQPILKDDEEDDDLPF